MMRRRFDQRLFRCAAVSCACGAIAATTGCAMMGHMRPAADSYTFDVGTASARDIHAKATDLFKRFGYEVAREDESKPVYLETEWQKRPPADDDERTRGYEIISRIKLAGAPRDVTGAPVMYHVLLTVENRFIPTRGTHRDARDVTSSTSYAQTIVKGMAVAFGGTARPVASEPRPF
jgi:hypothetical protein